MMRKVGSKYVLFSKDGSRRLDSFDSREAAEARERQINAELSRTNTPGELQVLSLECDKLEKLNLFHSEAVQLSSQPLLTRNGEEVPRLFREAFILRPGIYNGRYEFTADDLREIAENFDSSDPPPVQVDHSESAYDTHGYVQGLKCTGLGDNTKLYALLEVRGGMAVDKVDAGLWRKLSGGFYRSPVQKMRETSFTPNPAVGGPEPATILNQQSKTGGIKRMSIPHKLLGMLIERAREEKGIPVSDLAASAGLTEETLSRVEAGEHDLSDQQTLKQVRTAAESLSLEKVDLDPIFAKLSKEPDPEKASEPAPEPVKLGEETSPEVAAILKAHQEEIAQLKAQQLEAAKVQRLKDDTRLIEDLARESKLLPKDSETFLAFIQTLSIEQRDAWAALKRQEQPVVELGRRSLPDLRVPNGDQTQAQAHQEAEALLAASGYTKNDKGQWRK